MNEDTAPFTADCIADSRDNKESLLREYLTNDNFEQVDGVSINRNKFLYLYGEENTGKLHILKKIAEEVYGPQWETKIYLRIDEGQKYPYKLHAHKVESSRRVIFVTKSRLSWQKWKDLYPSLKTYQFVGEEINETHQGLLHIQYSEYILRKRQRQLQFRNDVQALLQENLISESIFKKLMERIKDDFINQHNELIASEDKTHPTHYT